MTSTQLYANCCLCCDNRMIAARNQDKQIVVNYLYKVINKSMCVTLARFQTIINDYAQFFCEKHMDYPLTLLFMVLVGKFYLRTRIQNLECSRSV